MSAADKDARGENYRAALQRALPRLLGSLDRERDSRTFGSFDREHWGWKFRDFPVTMSQYGMLPLARVWAGTPDLAPYSHSEQLVSWIEGAVESTLARQHVGGAFDSVAPFSQDHGVTLAMAYVLAETATCLGEALPTGVHGRIDAALLRAADFAAKSEEDYAFISNHQALFALSYRALFERTNEDRFDRASARVVEAILEQQSSDGWYAEYGGPDPGYETLGLHYLALLWQRTQDAGLLDSLKRSVDFLSWCVHPDGSLGGAYGSRHTQLYYPAGLEILSAHLPGAAAISRFVAARPERFGVVTLDSVDAQNLPTLAASYVEAARAAPTEQGRESEQRTLPCEDAEVAGDGRDFAEAGIRIVSNRHYYGVIHGKKGGVCRIFSRTTGEPLFEDAGWVARGPRGECWTSQRLGAGAFEPSLEPGRLLCRAQFSEARQEMPTPFRFLVLRILNLTAFRSLRLGSWIRRQVIERLITAAAPVPLWLEREFEFAEFGFTVRDRLRADGAVGVKSLSTPAMYTSIHMGSAKYFHAAELDRAPRDFDEGKALQSLEASGMAAVEFQVRIPR